MEEAHDDILDVVGIGFGPANLALAIAVAEQRPIPRARFFEAQDKFAWHPAMMIGGSSVQNSFLKDLVTLRNPKSAFSFLAYLKDQGRLHKFINLAQPHATRWEFNDYFSWAARAFSEVVSYGCKVVRVEPNGAADGSVQTITVTAVDARGQQQKMLARNIVIATGGIPNMLSGVVPESPRVIHTAKFLDRLPQACPERGAAITLAVVGAGQSGAEAVHHLLAHYPRATVHWIIPGSAPRPADESPWVNDIFIASEVDKHYAGVGDSGDSPYHDDLRNSNYGVADAELLAALYRMEYDGIARDDPRFRLHRRTRLLTVTEQDARIRLETTGPDTCVDVDVLVLATGYTRCPLPDFADALLPLLQKDARGEPVVEREYRLASCPAMTAGVFVQGLAERSHGLGDTLFPILPFRAAEIATQISAAMQPQRAVRYPPARHMEQRLDRLLTAIRRYPFATLISMWEGRLDASHIPMILDESTGPNGRLFGHLDAENPQVSYLDGHEMLAIFQGPNAYISPHIYETDQLPTWNFVAVHVRGVIRVIRDRQELVTGLRSIPVHADRRPNAYRLDPQDRRIPLLINGIVGFYLEITEIEGRFKLSQDRDPADRAHASAELAGTAAGDQATFIDWLHDVQDVRQTSLFTRLTSRGES